MAKAVLGWNNLAVLGVVSATSQQPALPATSLQQAHLAVKWRSTSLATQNIDLDNGSAKTMGLIGLFGSNLTSAATWTITMGTTQGASGVYSSGSIAASVVAGYGQAIHLLPADLSARWCRIALVDAANPDGFMEAGALFVGPSFRPQRNFSYGRALGFVDPSVRSKSKGGQLYSDLRDRYRAQEFEFEGLTEAELFNEALEMDRQRGVADSILFCPDDAGTFRTRTAIWGTIADATPGVHTALPVYGKRYRIEERL